MSKIEWNKSMQSQWKILSGKIKEIILLSILAIALIFAAWKIFHTEESTQTSVLQATETEAKIMRLLSEIEGVGKANVFVCETEDGIESVAVVCEGANDLRVVMNVRSAVSAALGTAEKNVKVYLRKE